MAKRGTSDEKPYDPFAGSLVNSVLAHTTAPVPAEKPVVMAVVPKAEISEPAEPKLQTPERAEPKKQPQQLRQSPLSMPDANPQRLELRKHLLRIPIPLKEKFELERLVTNLSSSLGTSVQITHIVRGLISLLTDAEDELIRRAKKVNDPRLVRPSNKNLIALADFEDGVTELVDQAVRSSLARRAPREG